MDFRKNKLVELFNGFLDRKTVPLALASREGSAQAEADILLDRFIRSAPRDEAEAVEWAGHVFDHLDSEMTTRSWPTVKEWIEAFKATPRKKPVGDETEFNSLKVMAGKIKRGDPVGEGYIWGCSVHDMIRAGLIVETDLEGHRSAVFFSERETYSEDVARKKEEIRMASHRAAAALGEYGNGGMKAPKVSPRMMPGMEAAQ